MNVVKKLIGRIIDKPKPPAEREHELREQELRTEHRIRLLEDLRNDLDLDQWEPQTTPRRRRGDV